MSTVIRPLAAALVTVTASLGVGSASAAPGPHSGVRGVVLYGPTCPVQRPGQTCERPYQATVTFSRASSPTVAARIRTGTNGRFTVRLRAGRYLVKATNGAAHSRPPSQVVTVTAHHFTAVTIRFDSGIR
jgi:hypothetical protein